jgi:hypothetical protein
MSRRAIVTHQDWLNDANRRMAAQDRRRGVSTAADLLGPGIAPQATLVADWNDEVFAFNGFYYSQPGALHSPDNTKAWIGYSVTDADGSGIQQVWTYVTAATDLGSWTPAKRARAFVTPDGTTRVFSTWQTA